MWKRLPPRVRGMLPLVLAVALFVAPREARADWESARKFFLEGMRSPDWKVRRNACGALQDYDGGPAASLLLSTLGPEAHLAVEAAALEVLGGMRSAAARAAVIAALQKGKPSERLRAALVLSTMRGNEVDAALVEALTAGPPILSAQAALALGQPGRTGALAPLVKALAHDVWQVRSAAARALGALGDKEAGKTLVEHLKTERGRVRAEVIGALEALSGQKLGDSPLKWAAWADGQDPSKVEEKPTFPPTCFGAPVVGERVVFVLDRSLNMRDAHPYTGPDHRERLEALCTPPDGNRIPWRTLKTKLQLAAAHIDHAVDGMPPGSRLEVVHFAADVKGVFGLKLTPISAAVRKTLGDTLAALTTDDGIDIYDALNAALDIAGPTEEKAWRGGPDQILFVTNNVPTAGEVKEADVILSAIAYKARLRMVPITTIGIGNHPFDLARGLAKRTGGVYVDLSK